MPLPSQRHLFAIPDDVVYLNCAYMSPLMRTVQQAGEAGIAAKVHPWSITPEDFFTTTERTRAAFATLVNASAEDVAIVPAVSYGAAVAVRNLPLAAGQEILCLEDQFPSNVYPWRRMAADRGASLRLIRRSDARLPNGAIDWTGALLAALSDRTAILALPHCHWTDGTRIDLVRVGKAARQYGAALFVDLTQSAGAMPFDVAEIQPDFAVAAAYKWLLGPYSLGFLYVAPQWQDGVPLEENWIARAGSEDFAGLVNYQEAYQPGARRFDMGERSNFHLMPMALTALEQILAWGVADIAETLGAFTDQIARRAAHLGFTATSAAYRAPHYLGLRHEDGMPADLVVSLAQENIYLSQRGDSLRVTPHLYNGQTDLDRLFAALQEKLGAGGPEI